VRTSRATVAGVAPPPPSPMLFAAVKHPETKMGTIKRPQTILFFITAKVCHAFTGRPELIKL
jgi:hypothetical protein